MSTQLWITPCKAGWLVTSRGEELAVCKDESSSITLAKTLAKWSAHLGHRCDVTFCDRNDMWFSVSLA